MTGDWKGVSQTPVMSSGIPVNWTLELQSIARIVVGFLVFRHGMEQVLGFPAAGTEVPTASSYGLLKLLCFLNARIAHAAPYTFRIWHNGFGGFKLCREPPRSS
jgi:hypothetical protein